MNHFVEYAPLLAGGYANPREFDFETIQDLMDHPIIRESLSLYPDSCLTLDGNHLNVIHNHGFGTWTIGSIKDPDSLNFPKTS